MLSRRLTIFTVFWMLTILLLVTSINFFRMQSFLEEENRAAQVQTLSYFRNRIAAHQQAMNLAGHYISEADGLSEALARGDREALQAQTEEIIRGLNEHTDTHIAAIRFYLPPGLKFLDTAPMAQDDVIQMLKADAIETVFQTGQSVQTWAVDNHGISLLDISPIYYQGRLIAVLEIVTDVNDQTLRDLTQYVEAQWQVSIRADAASRVGFSSRIQTQDAPEDILLLQSLSGAVPVFNTRENYLATLEDGIVTTSLRRQGGQVYSVLSSPITDANGEIIGVLDIIQNQTAQLANQFNTLVSNLLIIASVLAVGSLGLGISINRAIAPLSEMRRVAERVAEGEYNVFFQETRRTDEIGQLGRALNTMITQVRDLIANLDARVRERTAALERRASLLQATSDVGNIVITGQEIDQALRQIAFRISERFGFYHVGIFLLDERHEYAVLRAANSAGGQRMLARQHKLRVGQVGIVGYVAATGRPRIALDVGQDAVYFDNPDLPETRSEMALPIVLHQQVIGVLDIQSREANAFTDEDVSVLQTLANQIAIALENARLYQEAQQVSQTLNRLLEEQTLSSWREFAQRRAVTGFISVAQGGLLELAEPQIGPAHKRALQERQPQTSDDGLTLIAPIALRKTTIGLLRLTKRSGLPPWSDEEKNMVALLLNQLAAAIENARLYTETQQQALIDHAIGEISSRLSMAVDVESILREAAVGLGRYLSNSEIIIKTIEPHEGGPADA